MRIATFASMLHLSSEEILLINIGTRNKFTEVPEPKFSDIKLPVANLVHSKLPITKEDLNKSIQVVFKMEPEDLWEDPSPTNYQAFAKHCAYYVFVNDSALFVSHNRTGPLFTPKGNHSHVFYALRMTKQKLESRGWDKEIRLYKNYRTAALLQCMNRLNKM